MKQTEDNEEQTEEIEETEEVLEKKPRKKMVFTEEQLVKKRLSLQRAREIRNNKIKSQNEEIQKLKEEKAKPKVVEKPVEEEVKQKKKKVIREIVKYETDSDEEDVEYEDKIIIKKKPREPKELSKNSLIQLTYRERLQEQLKQEKMKVLMGSLFDF